MKHTFAISAYGDSPYLESCIKSLTGQTVRSDIIMCTSTPSDYLMMMAEKYDIPLYVRTGEPGIGYDWNYAYSKSDSDLITIAHQDDIYHHDYVKTLLETKQKYPDMSVFMTASVTIKNGKLVEYGGIEIVKKLLRTPLRIPRLNHMPVIKKAAVRLGNPIICPSCTYDKNLCGEGLFDTQYQFVLDWDALYRLASEKGRWVCIERPLIMYRVHADAATSTAINNNVREREESEMFDRMHKGAFSEFLKKTYRKSYDAYKE
ncbi:MAG: glycosyltransferase [Lachnospiraceae bacterium]|nr:glycosyltransferase [Lachnospiraceae bacterium]